jgi:hypothetical protein
MKIREMVRTVGFCTLFVIACTAARADDAVLDFSSTANPNGPWSYGITPSLGGAFSLLPSGTCGALAGWNGSSSSPGMPPFVFGNKTGVTQTCGGGQDPPTLLDMHPGPTGQYADVRWTATSAETVNISGLFEGIDPTPTTTDVHVLLDNTPIFNGNISSFNVPLDFTIPGVLLSAGNTIDFVVGFGADASFLDDSTGFDATITTTSAVPAPLIGRGLPVLLAVGGLLFGAKLLERRKKHGLQFG